MSRGRIMNHSHLKNYVRAEVNKESIVVASEELSESRSLVTAVDRPMGARGGWPIGACLHQPPLATFAAVTSS